MGRANQRGPLTARIWLTIVVFCQIFLTPMAAFSITYLLQLDMTGENITIGIQKEMPELLVLQDLPTVGVIIAAMLIFGILMSLIATNMAVGKYLRMNEDDLYR